MLYSLVISGSSIVVSIPTLHSVGKIIILYKNNYQLYWLNMIGLYQNIFLILVCLLIPNHLEIVLYSSDEIQEAESGKTQNKKPRVTKRNLRNSEKKRWWVLYYLWLIKIPEKTIFISAVLHRGGYWNYNSFFLSSTNI